MNLRPYQSEAIAALRRSLGAGHKRPILVSPTGCHAAGTKILMHDGSIKPIERIAVGDQVMGPDSLPRNVLSLHRGIDEMFRVTPTKGEPFVVNGGHVLALKRTQDGTRLAGTIEFITVRQWLSCSKTQKHVRKLFRVPIEFAAASLPIDPYMLGVILGDGSLTNGITVSKPDIEIWRAAQDFAASAGVAVNDISFPGRCPTFSLATPRGKVNPLRIQLANLGLIGCKSGDKFVPSVYLTSSREQRLQILAGLLDTDGSLQNGGFDFISKSQRLAEGVVFLARSLGFSAYLSPCRKGCGDFEGAYWRTNINGNADQIPTRIARKKAVQRRQKKDVLVTGMTVAPVGVGAYYGFECDGDHLYVMADFTVTHNSGKTVVAAEIVRSAVEKRRRVLFLAPRRELIHQASEKLQRLGIGHGIIMAGVDRSIAPDVQVASFDTLHARGMRTQRMRMPPADVVIVDEAHLSVADTRQAIIEHYADAVVIGLTATPARGDGRGLGEIYDDLVMPVSVRQLTDDGYLVPARYFAPSEPDLQGIKLDKDGDYQQKALGQRMDKTELIGDIVDNWMRLAFGMSTVVFCVTRAHSRHVAERFNAVGISAEHLDGETPIDERAAILARVASGETLVLSNVYVVTFGLDIPRLQCAVLARPTKNLALYLQIAGRVLRPAEGKTEARIIDHSGAVQQHGFVDEDQPWSLDEAESIRDRKERQRQAKKAAKEIVCGKCKTVFKGRRDCPNCGFAMVPRGEAVPTHEAQLQEVGKENRETSWDEKVAFIGGLKAYAAEHGYSAGWIAHKYRTRFGVWPNDPRVKNAPPMQYDEPTRKWLLSQQIRYAKSRIPQRPAA